MPSFPITVSDSGTPLQFFSPSAGSDPTFNESSSFNGPYVIGTSRYLSGGDADTGKTSVIKSVDFGVTWAAMDQANGIDSTTAITSVLDMDGIRIWVVFGDVTATMLSIAVFDTSTDTWGPVLDSIIIPGAGIIQVLFSAVQDSSNNIVVAGTFSFILDPDQQLNCANSNFIVFNGSAWGTFQNFSTPPRDPGHNPAALSGFLSMMVAGDVIHCFFAPGNFDTDSLPLYHQSINGSGFSLGTLEAIGNSESNLQNNTSGGATLPLVGAFDSATGLVSVVASGIGTPKDFTKLFTASSANGENLNLSLSTYSPGLTAGRKIAAVFLLSFSAGVLYTFYIDYLADTDASMTFLVNYAEPTVLGPVVLGPNTGCIQATTAPVISGFVLAFTASQYYWEQAGIPPPVVTTVAKSVGGGATYFPRYFNKSFLIASIARIYGHGLSNDWVTFRDGPYPPLSSFFLFPNYADLCLSREFQLYNLIDREAMSCARKPDCFLRSERDWQDSPPGWRPFNPVGVLPLPAPGDGDVVVLSFRVPYGYDGVITAQYHGYTNNFTQGSGDIVWRVRADGRYLRDAGNMSVSIGNPKQLSPVNGGLQLRSGNLVEYIVSAPNASGLLPPGGNILAGLHGLFYPRL